MANLPSTATSKPLRRKAPTTTPKAPATKNADAAPAEPVSESSTPAPDTVVVLDLVRVGTSKRFARWAFPEDNNNGEYTGTLYLPFDVTAVRVKIES